MPNQDNAMAIEQGYTPSNLADSSLTQKNGVATSSEEFAQPKEFKIEEEKP